MTTGGFCCPGGRAPASQSAVGAHWAGLPRPWQACSLPRCEGEGRPLGAARPAPCSPGPRSPAEGCVCPARAAPRRPHAQEHPPPAHSAATGSPTTSALQGNGATRATSRLPLPAGPRGGPACQVSRDLGTVVQVSPGSSISPAPRGGRRVSRRRWRCPACAFGPLSLDRTPLCVRPP